MRASPCIKYVLSRPLHRPGGAVQTDLSAKAPECKRRCCTYSAWGAASQSAPLLVTFGVKSDMQGIIVQFGRNVSLNTVGRQPIKIKKDNHYAY